MSRSGHPAAPVTVQAWFVLSLGAAIPRTRARTSSGRGMIFSSADGRDGCQGGIGTAPRLGGGEVPFGFGDAAVCLVAEAAQLLQPLLVSHLLDGAAVVASIELSGRSGDLDEGVQAEDDPLRLERAAPQGHGLGHAQAGAVDLSEPLAEHLQALVSLGDVDPDGFPAGLGQLVVEGGGEGGVVGGGPCTPGVAGAPASY